MDLEEVHQSSPTECSDFTHWWERAISSTLRSMGSGASPTACLFSREQGESLFWNWCRVRSSTTNWIATAQRIET